LEGTDSGGCGTLSNGLSSSISEQVAERLAPYLGEFNATIWVQQVAKRDLDIAPEALDSSHVPTLVEGLRPSLNTFLGREAAAELLEKILREVG